VDQAYSALARGWWRPNELAVTWQERLHQLPASLAAEIDSFWREKARQGLYNGRMARLEEFELCPSSLWLRLSLTDYKTLLYSNAHKEEILQRWPAQILARAVGVSALVKTSDRLLVLIRRSKSVGEYPCHYDVLGGHIDAAWQGDPQAAFSAVQQELFEEAALAARDYALHCFALIETVSSAKPELLFVAESRLSRQQIIERTALAIDQQEYEQLLFVNDDHEAIQDFLANEKEISPSAIGCLCEYGRRLSAAPPTGSLWTGADAVA